MSALGAFMHSFLCYDTRYVIQRQFRISKFVYCICYFLIAIVMWALRDYADEWFAQNSYKYSYCTNENYENLCTGKTSAKRFSMASFVFFFLHAIFLVNCKNETSKRIGIHVSMWVWKMLMWGGLIVAFLFVPDDVITVYSHAAR